MFLLIYLATCFFLFPFFFCFPTTLKLLPAYNLVIKTKKFVCQKNVFVSKVVFFCLFGFLLFKKKRRSNAFVVYFCIHFIRVYRECQIFYMKSNELDRATIFVFLSIFRMLFTFFLCVRVSFVRLFRFK